MRMYQMGMLLLGFIVFSAIAEDNKRTDDLSDVRGAIVYRTYCVLCHGPNGDGKGRAAKNYTPRPANLIQSVVSDDYKKQIITKGGGAMGRSPYMPPWGGELTDEQIRDVVAYLRLINVNHAAHLKD